MLYIVGGCGRSGKSTLAGRMLDRHRIPWFALDALKMGLHLGAPVLGVHPDEDELETADRMWPIVEGLLDHLLFDGRDYLVEGVDLRPETVAAFMAASGAVRACFLGYPDIDLDRKAAHVADYTGVPTDWLNRTGPDNIRRYIDVSRTLSRRLRASCATTGVPFIDTGGDFAAGLVAAERALTGPDGDVSG